MKKINIKEQIQLYKKVNLIRRSINPIVVTAKQKKYIKEYLKLKRRKIKIIISLIAAIVFLELALPIFVDIFLRQSALLLNLKNFFYGIIILIIFIIFYLYLNYENIKRQRLFFLEFINILREDWVKYYLRKNKITLSSKEIGKLYVKVTFHLSLLLTGLTNSVFNLFQWALLSIGLILLSLFNGPVSLILTVSAIFISFIVMYIGYIVSVYHIGHNQTLYSKILQYISDGVHDFNLIRTTNKEKLFMNKLKVLVEIDTHFRVQREIFLNFGYKLLFSILILISAFGYISEIYINDISFVLNLDSLLFLIISLILVRIIYLALNIGLYYFPLKIGIILCVPEISQQMSASKKNFNNLKKIEFRSNKFRFSEKLPYQKKLKFIFEMGKKYLIIGDTQKGKSFLANIFNGTVSINHSVKWVVKINNKYRTGLSTWVNSNKKVYYINPHFKSNVSIYETIENGENESTTFFDEIKNELGDISNMPFLDFLTADSKFFGSKKDATNYSFNENAIIQILYCILNKPDIVIIDNLWIELNNKNVNQALEFLFKKLNDKIIIAFSNQESPNLNLNYDKKYNI